MIGHLRVVVALLGASVRAQLAYRASFAMQVVAQAVLTALEFVGIWALFDRFGALPGWSLGEVALLYGLVGAGFALADGTSNGFDHLGQHIKRGTLDTYLLRPRPVALQLLGYELTLRRAGRLVQAIAILVVAWAYVGLPLTASHVALAIAIVAGCGAFFLGLFVLQATLTFWTVETLEVANALTYGGVETAQYPLPIYPRALRLFLTCVVPTACVSYFPVVALLGKHDPLGSPRWAQLAGPAVGPVFLAFALWLFGSVGLRRYTSTGS